MANELCSVGHDLAFTSKDHTVSCTKCDAKIGQGRGMLVCSLCTFTVCGDCLPKLNAYLCATDKC
jgi:hypothetical protein